MRSRRKLILLSFLLIGTLFLTACPQDRTDIAKINADPGRFRDKEVGVVGRVLDSYSVLGTGAYEVDDGTGRIWVVTRRGGVPSRGSRVGVAGRVHTGFTIGGRSFGTVLEESERKSR